MLLLALGYSIDLNGESVGTMRMFAVFSRMFVVDGQSADELADVELLDA